MNKKLIPPLLCAFFLFKGTDNLTNVDGIHSIILLFYLSKSEVNLR